MSVKIEMPKLSDTMTEGTLVKWHKQVGDSVEIGDVIAEVETDKATMEMEAFDDGVLTEILVQAGEKAPIGGILAILNGDSGSAPDAAHTQVVPAAAAPPPVSTPASAPAPAAAPRAEGERILVSPLARKVAADLGVNLENVSGTGPAGRIVRSDVEAAAKSPAAKPAASSEAAAAAALAASIKAKASATPAPATTPTPAYGVKKAKPLEMDRSTPWLRRLMSPKPLAWLACRRTDTAGVSTPSA